jgi:hypothetical protein
MRKGFSACSIVLLLALIITPLAFAKANDGPQAFPNLSFKDDASTNHATSVQPGVYWFQVGAWAANGLNYGDRFGIPVTGASVEIQVRYPQRASGSSGAVSYWVGINLPGDAFIQVGYLIDSDNFPKWFWEFFTPKSALEGAGRFHGELGSAIGPNNSWFKFSITSSGTVWKTFVGDTQVGSIDLHVANSGTNGPYATAEAAQVRNANTVLGPVEFRNLAYRDTSGQWVYAGAAVSLCCYGVGSDTYSGRYPYGVRSLPGDNNHWSAGSNLTSAIQQGGTYLWPWYRVTIALPSGNHSAWYLYRDTVNLSAASSTVPISATSRYMLEGWYVNDTFEKQSSFSVTGNMVLKPKYVKQYRVQVMSPIGTATGSGWYGEGTASTIGVMPNVILAQGILGSLGVKTVLSGWSGDFNGPLANGESTVLVNSPLTITAVWRTDYSVLSYLLLLAAVVIAVAFLSEIQRRRANTR